MSIEDIYKLKSIHDYTLEMYHRIRICWEEMNVENAGTDVLIKARDTIQKELDKRLRLIIMGEIEKLYENAKIAPKRCSECDNNMDCGFGRDCYPPFTAEKQIAILQLLTQKCDLTISHFTEWEFIHFDGQEPIQVTGKDFKETFARLINAYWQSLTEKEKQEIKMILERVDK